MQGGRGGAPAGALAGDVEGAGLGRIIEFVEGNPPRPLETTAALLDEDILEGLGAVVEA